MIAFVMMGVLAVLGFLCVSEVVPVIAKAQRTHTHAKGTAKHPSPATTVCRPRRNSKLDMVVPPSYRPFPATRPNS